MGVDHPESAAGSEQPRRLRVAQFRRDPVERRERDHGVEAPLQRLPRLEVPDLDLDPREGSELAAATSASAADSSTPVAA
ncbi:MAG TPA: hypothetical protein VGI69_03250 [Gaiellaceae bacterium]|jgi:hypothetical protein